MGFAARYIHILNGPSKWFILCTWVVLAGLAAWQAPLLVSRASTTFDPPSSSLAAKGDYFLSQCFPSRGVFSTFAIFVNGDIPVDSPQLRTFSEELNASFSPQPEVIGFQGYWILREMGLPSQMYQPFIAASGNATFFSLTLNLPFSAPAAIQWANDAKSTLQDITRRVLSSSSSQSFLLGIPAFIPVMIHDIELNLGTMDAIVLPISFLLFLLLVKSVRLLILPIVGMLLSLALSFASATLLSYFVPVMSYIPSLLMSLVIAMSFDYALFLSVRYREELYKKSNSSPHTNETTTIVSTVMATAGHTILVSGGILCVTFLIMVALPLTFVQVTGVCAALSIFFSLLVNLTVMPCLLLAFPNFFARCVEPFLCCGKRRLTYGTRPEYEALGGVQEVEEQKMQDSNWYRLGHLNSRPVIGVLFCLLCLAAVAPLAYFAVTYTQSDSLSQDLPRGSDISNGYAQFSEAFGPGFVYPLQLLVFSNETLISLEFFELVSYMVHNISIDTQTAVSNWNSVFFNPDSSPAMWYNIYSQCHLPGKDNNPLCRAVLYGDEQLLNGTKQATLILYSATADPLAPSGRQWLNQARTTLDRVLSAYPNVEAYFVGTPAASWDAINAVTQYFPIIIGASAGVVVLLLAIVFRSFLIPLRSVLSLSMAIFFVFGAAALVFDQGILDWLHFSGLHSSGGITWLIPVVTFSILIGISLDYDIFLLTRVEELRGEGMTTRDAIRAAQYYTGPVITVAGLIMAVAFSGLILSSTTSLNQMGFILSFSVIIDTFILRALFVPSIMALLGEASWWPRKMPPVVRTLPAPFKFICCSCCSSRKSRHTSMAVQ